VRGCDCLTQRESLRGGAAFSRGGSFMEMQDPVRSEEELPAAVPDHNFLF
jgi:hypothetical protein